MLDVTPAATSLDRSLETYLSSVALMMAEARANTQALFKSYEELVLAKGRRWTAARLPRGVRRGPMKYCYDNTLALVRRDPESLRYCEGFAIPLIDGETFIPVLHCWAVNRDGQVLDRTWPEPERSAYWGIAFDWAEVEAFDALGEDYLGILASEYLLRFPLLRTGRLFPDGEASDGTR